MKDREQPPGDPPRASSARPLLLFDGECGLCTASVRFILDRERDQALSFASLQSALGRAVVVSHGLDPDELSTLVLVDAQDRLFVRSTAALKVAGDHLRRPWSWAGMLRIVPRFLRDAGYRFVARYRIRWFGTADACELPAPGSAERFLDAL